MTLKVLKSKANTEAYATKRLERKQIMVKTVKRNIKEFLGMIKDGDVTLQPVYQRNECWKDDKKVKFIYSILSGYAELIPPFYYAINVDPETCVDKYKCIDSQQRTRTIIDFVNNKLPLNIQNDDTEEIMYRNCYFNNLPKHDKEYFLKQSINLITIHEILIEDEEVLFLFLNNGEPLNKSEMYYASSNTINKLVKDALVHTILINNMFRGKTTDRMNTYRVGLNILTAINKFFVAGETVESLNIKGIQSAVSKTFSNNNLHINTEATYKAILSSMDKINLEFFSDKRAMNQTMFTMFALYLLREFKINKVLLDKNRVAELFKAWYSYVKESQGKNKLTDAMLKNGEAGNARAIYRNFDQYLFSVGLLIKK